MYQLATTLPSSVEAPWMLDDVFEAGGDRRILRGEDSGLLTVCRDYFLASGQVESESFGVTVEDRKGS